MIVKKIKREKPEKPKAWQIGDLVDYIRSPKNQKPQEKIEYAGGKNFISFTHSGQKAEMVALALESIHSKMPVSHWLFSWQEGEQPTREQVEEIVDIFIEKMGLAGHQTIYALHRDTDNYHLHIAVNRMNPETRKVVLPFNGFDIREAHKILALIEYKQGWRPEENALYAILENGELARRRFVREIKPAPSAQKFEMATGEKSAQRIAQERGHEIIKTAKTWSELHENLASVGLRFEKKGSGAIIFVGENAVKASSVDRSFSMGKLIKKLGPFVSGKYEVPAKTPEPEPVSDVNLELWEKYKSEYERQTTLSENQAKLELACLKKRQRMERKNALSRLAVHGLPILNIASHCLKLQHKNEQKLLRAIQRKARKSKPDFETWLLKNGFKKEADLWRYRDSFKEDRHSPPPPDAGAQTMNELQDFLKYAEAVNADRYRVTCIKMDEQGGKKTFILDKKGGLTRGFSRDEIASHLPEMLRLQKRGENIYYTPLSDDRHHILVDDMSKESLEQLQQDGFTPAVVLESSPGNYQCVLTIARLGTEYDREVANRLTVMLNKKYGDKNLCGCIHPHRAPGFENRKPKYQRKDGSFPNVKLVRATRCECTKAFTMAKSIYAEFIATTKTRQRRFQILPQSRAGDAVKAYYAHLKNIRRHLSIEDYSRVDAMIALRLRANGHSWQAVAETIASCAPTIRDGQTESRNWQQYAERTANYAFGPAGDRDLMKNEKYHDLWRMVEGLEKGDRMTLRKKMR